MGNHHPIRSEAPMVISNIGRRVSAVSSDDPSSAAPKGTVDPDTAAAVLRAQLLADLDDEVWPMAHVESIINHRKLANTPAAHHALVLDIIGALLRDQLILVGDVVGGDPHISIPGQEHPSTFSSASAASTSITTTTQPNGYSISGSPSMMNERYGCTTQSTDYGVKKSDALRLLVESGQ